MSVTNLLGTAGAILALGLVFGLIERLFRDVPGRAWYRRRGTRTDLCWWFVSPLATKAITGFALAIALVLLARLLGYGAAELEAARNTGTLPDLSLFGLGDVVGAWPLVVQFLVGLFVIDLLVYGMHRAFHRRTLWPFHAVHHSSPRLDWLASARVHPVNELVMRVTQAIPLLLLGFRPVVFAFAGPILVLYGLLLHTNVRWSFGPLRYVLASPRFHRWHHSKEPEAINKNFAGLFPVLDLMFGTFYMPEGRTAQTFGVHDDSVPESFLGQIAHPFRRRKQDAQSSAAAASALPSK